MDIQLLHNDDIDRKLWDRHIAQSNKNPIFNFSWYLDVIDKDWYAFIKGEYEWVLPFFAENRQIQLPRWIPYLSVSSKHKLSKKERLYIEDYWAKHYKAIDHGFSKYQFGFSKSALIQKQHYYQKDLINDYNVLAFNFDKEVRDSLDVATKNKIRVLSFRSLYEYIEFAKLYSAISYDNILALRRVILKSVSLNSGKMYAVYNAKNQIEGVCFILYFRNRAYIMHAAFTAEGLELKADYMLINTLIKDLSLYNVSLENHAKTLVSKTLKGFKFGAYYSYRFQQSAKQNMLSLLFQFLRK